MPSLVRGQNKREWHVPAGHKRGQESMDKRSIKSMKSMEACPGCKVGRRLGGGEGVGSIG